MFHRSRLSALFAGVLALVGLAGSVGAEQKGSHIVMPGAYRIEVAVEKASSFDARGLLGTHSLWWGHQADLWVPGTTSNYPAVNSFFQSTKGIIRYGGGANEISWRTCGGPAVLRIAAKAVPWAGPMKCEFGIPEYLQTVRATGGQEAWLIANLAGLDQQIFSVPDMVAEVGGAAAMLQTEGHGLQRYWELGNEMWTGRLRWPPEMIANRANAAGQEIRRVDPAAKLVLPLIEYNDPRQPARKVFNERLLRAMTLPIDGIALHLYYDGAPGGPSIPTQISTVTDTAALYQKVHGGATPLWITEHGRWPEGEPGGKDWKSSWYKTNDMDGVLGTADFLIALAQIDDVAGAMLHGLRAGPWNIFDKTPLGPEPSGVGKLLLLFAEASPITRLQTRSTSQNQSEYKGGYDLRATAFASDDQRRISLWVINRAPTPIATELVLPATPSKMGFTKGSSLVCPVTNGRCAGSQYRVFPVNNEQVSPIKNGAIVNLPARSVTTLTFELQK